MGVPIPLEAPFIGLDTMEQHTLMDDMERRRRERGGRGEGGERKEGGVRKGGVEGRKRKLKGE